MQKATVSFKGEEREVVIDFSVLEDGSVDYNVTVTPEINPEDEITDLASTLSFFFLRSLEEKSQVE